MRVLTLLLHVVFAGHQTIIREIGASFEENDELLQYDHEIEFDFISPIVADLPKGKHEGKL